MTSVIPADRLERFRNRFKSNAGDLLGGDPVCNGRVSTGTIDQLAEHALALAESAVKGDRLDRQLRSPRQRRR